MDIATAQVLLKVAPSEIRNLSGLDRAVSLAWGDKVRVLPGSAHYPNQSDKSLVVAILQTNQERREIAQGLEGFKVVTANVFRDAQDALWRKVGDGDGALIVREAEEDIAELLKTRKSLSLATASVEVELNETFRHHEGIGWYDCAKEQMRYGIALTDKVAVDIDTGKAVSMDARAVVLAADLRPHAPELSNALRLVREKAALPAANALFGRDSAPITAQNAIAKHIQYMGILYRDRPEYFNRLKGLLKRAYGESALPASD